jgi:hypothetical protein
MRTNVSAGHDSAWEPPNAAAPSSCTPQQFSSFWKVITCQCLVISRKESKETKLIDFLN